MSAGAILQAAKAAGVTVALASSGSLSARGPRDAVNQWRPALIANKAAILETLGRAALPRPETWEEKAAHLEFAVGLPRSWAESFAKMLTAPPPGDFPAQRWQEAVDAGWIFAQGWSALAHSLGWTPEEVFGLHPAAPAARHDSKGVAWLLGEGQRVVGLDADGADILCPSGARLRYYRRLPGPLNGPAAGPDHRWR